MTQHTHNAASKQQQPTQHQPLAIVQGSNGANNNNGVVSTNNQSTYAGSPSSQSLYNQPIPSANIFMPAHGVHASVGGAATMYPTMIPTSNVYVNNVTANVNLHGWTQPIPTYIPAGAQQYIHGDMPSDQNGPILQTMPTMQPVALTTPNAIAVQASASNNSGSGGRGSRRGRGRGGSSGSRRQDYNTQRHPPPEDSPVPLQQQQQSQSQEQLAQSINQQQQQQTSNHQQQQLEAQMMGGMQPAYSAHPQYAQYAQYAYPTTYFAPQNHMLHPTQAANQQTQQPFYVPIYHGQQLYNYQYIGPMINSGEYQFVPAEEVQGDDRQNPDGMIPHIWHHQPMYQEEYAMGMGEMHANSDDIIQNASSMNPSETPMLSPNYQMYDTHIHEIQQQMSVMQIYDDQHLTQLQGVPPAEGMAELVDNIPECGLRPNAVQIVPPGAILTPMHPNLHGNSQQILHNHMAAPMMAIESHQQMEQLETEHVVTEDYNGDSNELLHQFNDSNANIEDSIERSCENIPQDYQQPEYQQQEYQGEVEEIPQQPSAVNIAHEYTSHEVCRELAPEDNELKGNVVVLEAAPTQTIATIEEQQPQQQQPQQHTYATQQQITDGPQQQQQAQQVAQVPQRNVHNHQQHQQHQQHQEQEKYEQQEKQHTYQPQPQQQHYVKHQRGSYYSQQHDQQQHTHRKQYMPQPHQKNYIPRFHNNNNNHSNHSNNSNNNNSSNTHQHHQSNAGNNSDNSVQATKSMSWTNSHQKKSTASVAVTATPSTNNNSNNNNNKQSSSSYTKTYTNQQHHYHYQQQQHYVQQPQHHYNQQQQQQPPMRHHGSAKTPTSPPSNSGAASNFDRKQNQMMQQYHQRSTSSTSNANAEHFQEQQQNSLPNYKHGHAQQDHHQKSYLNKKTIATTTSIPAPTMNLAPPQPAGAAAAPPPSANTWASLFNSKSNSASSNATPFTISTNAVSSASTQQNMAPAASNGAAALNLKKPVAKVAPYDCNTPAPAAAAQEVPQVGTAAMSYSAASSQALVAAAATTSTTFNAAVATAERTTKPESVLPARNPDECSIKFAEFLSKYKTDLMTISLRPRGLTNRSNYCYINSILQALLGCAPFYNMIRSIPKQAIAVCDVKTPIINAMLSFVGNFSSLPAGLRLNNRLNKAGPKGKDSQGGELQCDSAVEPTEIYKLWNESRDEHVEGRQEDAEEFLGYVLNKINDEMLEVIKLIARRSSDQNGHDAETEEGDAWQMIRNNRNKGSVTRQTDFGRTPLSDIFRGELRSRLQREGEHSTDVIQPFFTLQLNIEKAASVKEALEILVGRDQLEGVTGSKTKQEVVAWQQMTLEKLPVVLILHLKWFDYRSDGCTKILKTVEFPVELKIDPKILSSKKYSQKQRMYRLFAVVYHDGKEASKGHYITDVYHTGYSSWLRFDDSSVKPVSEHNVLRPHVPRVPYLLYYRRCDTLPHSLSANCSSTSTVGSASHQAGGRDAKCNM